MIYKGFSTIQTVVGLGFLVAINSTVDLQADVLNVDVSSLAFEDLMCK